MTANGTQLATKRHSESVRVGNGHLDELRVFARRHRLTLADAMGVVLEHFLSLDRDQQRAAIERDTEEREQPRRQRRRRT